MELSPTDARFESIGNGDAVKRDQKHYSRLTGTLRERSRSLEQPHVLVAPVVSIVHPV